ncbi:cytochrome c [Gluconobacter albidus]|uniref:Cytochrome c n=1 Tax=Gluconobacter albidus TaxID=318683 RepID=A0ABQ5X2I0_9PROT|nr:cytochrome c [Gluconobacter albidus]GBQ89234.1 gluconate 2-dehydrogenase, cytochrome c subunit [Gluconobacter albidus NBRC 3250]GLQ69972.1 cytochrome c [Gluconobacter albidus]
MKWRLFVACLLGAGLTGSATAQDADKATLEKGRYLAAASDCAACHSVHGKPEYSGGVSFSLPMGKIYSTNITPDPEHGIGRYTEAQFGRAVREGIRRDGSTLYPAMPFPSYARMTDSDIHALFVYFRKGVPAASVPTPDNEIPWPLSMRWPLTVWRWVFAPTPHTAIPRTAGEFTDPQLARGAYLVEGPAHCGACHSPRAITMQEKALTADGGSLYLSGGAVVDGWTPPSLRQENRTGLGRWREEDIVAFLKTGRAETGSVFGSMTSAVLHGTQKLTDEDLRAIAHYLKSLQAADHSQTPWTYDPTITDQLHKANLSSRGARVYIDRCAACHRTDGKGYPAVFPPLAGNPVVMQSDPVSLVHIVQAGATLPAMMAAPSSIAMPAFNHKLTDQQIADVVTFIRKAWGNNASPVSADDVKQFSKSMPPSDMADDTPALN